jgi:dipeptidyl aminopeptidase/acylaminoacyl peptidase
MIATLLFTLFSALSLQNVDTLTRQIHAPLPIGEALGALHFSLFAPVDLSSDGKWVAYTLQDDRRRERPKEGYVRAEYTHTGVSQTVVGCDIWIANTQTGESKNLTGGKGSNWSPVWSPDGKSLAFYSDRSGAANLWVWEQASGKLRQISAEIVRPTYAAEVARWSSDGRRVLVKILPKGMTIESAMEAIISPQQIEKQGVKNPTVLIYRSSGGKDSVGSKKQYDKDIWVSLRRADLAIIEVSSGKVERITNGYNPAWYDFSPDGNKVAFTSIKGIESQQTQQRVYDLVVISLSNRSLQVVAPEIQLDYVGMTVSWSPDGKMLSYVTSSSGGPVRGDCFVVSVSGEAPRNITPTPHPYFGYAWRAPLWDATGENIYLLSSDSIWKASVRKNSAEVLASVPDRRIIEAVAPREGGRLWSPDGGRSMIAITRDDQTKQEGFYKIDLATGEYEKLLEERKSYGYYPILTIDVSHDGKEAIFISQDVKHCTEIWRTDIDFERPKQVTRTNPQLDKYVMGDSRVIEWRSLDGEAVRGALLLPSDYQEGRRYPLIVRIYPGHNLSDNVNSFGLNPFGGRVDNEQLFATRGYAVLLADSARPKGNPMRGIGNSVLPGISKLVELGIADSEKLGLIGHSNGGYGALSMIVQTTRFKAAVCSGGIGNNIGFYGFMGRDGSSWAVAYQEETLGMGGPPWQNLHKYIENSPVFYLDNVRTPLLLVHGAEDNVTPSFLADEVFVGLRRLGKEVEYAKYEGEGHWEGAWDHINQVDYLNRIIDWFDKHLKIDQKLNLDVEDSNRTR